MVGARRRSRTVCSRSARLGRLASAVAAVGQRVRMLTQDGEVRGVVVGPEEGELDVGDPARRHRRRGPRGRASSSSGRATRSCSTGRPSRCRTGAILSAALDDRVGIFVGARGRCAGSPRDPPAWDVALVVSAQEETGTHGGARVGRRARSRPTWPIVLEVTYAGDAPGPAPWGADVQPRRRPDRVPRRRSSARIVGDGLLAVAAEGAASRSRSRPARTTATRTPTTSSRPAAGVAVRDRLHPAALHAHGRRDRAALRRGGDASRLVEAYVAIAHRGDASFLR